jgi:NADH:ubiquinone oxidoreductase subunit 6 (subunit J)
MIVHVLILWGVIGAAAAVSVLVNRRRPPEAAPEYQSALTFVGAAYGLLLGLLVVFAVGHFNDVRNQAQQEASSLVTLFDTASVYPPETSYPVQHDLVCYMGSIVHDEWPSMERGGLLEAPRTLGFGDRLRADLRTLPANGPAQGTAYGRAATLIGDAGGSRQRLLFLEAPEIPTALWVVIYVGASLVFLLLAVHTYASRPAGRLWALGSVAVLMTVAVAVLAMLDQPFGIGVRVQPDQMSHAVHLLLTGQPTPLFRALMQPCS